MEKAAFQSELRRRLRAAARRQLRVLRSPSGECVEYDGPTLLAAADAAARGYSQGKPGRVVLLLLPHCPELFLLHVGLVLAGNCPAILPWPTTRVDVAKYQNNLLHQLRSLSADLLITLPKLAESLNGRVGFAVESCRIENSAAFEQMFTSRMQMDAAPKTIVQVEERKLPEGTVFVQFSGGTTGMQKAVAVTSPMLVSHLARLAQALSFGASDCVVSWLPMYHDMGLIACLWLPLWTGAMSVQFAASDWLLRPEMLFELMEQHQGTLTWLPNFSFSYLAQRAPMMTRRYQLDHVRAFVNCSEPVRDSSVASFITVFDSFGVRPQQVQASYAMAENVFAVTQTKMSESSVTVPRSVVRDANACELAFGLGERVFVSSGTAIADTQIRIVDSQGTMCADGFAGEIQIRSASLFAGYWAGNMLDRRSLTADGFHVTGDYGFIRDGELFVIGRIKDLIIVAGQNIFPEDVEALVNELPGVYPGRVVAFGLDDQVLGTQALAVVAELRGEPAPESARALEAEIRKTVLAGIGIAPRYAVAVPQRWIVKSTAGKISRRDTKQRFLEERTATASR
jgi:acyl-CoA synthetase (AMP-forming)/AMP-acid ligase II